MLLRTIILLSFLYTLYISSATFKTLEQCNVVNTINNALLYDKIMKIILYLCFNLIPVKRVTFLKNGIKFAHSHQYINLFSRCNQKLFLNAVLIRKHFSVDVITLLNISIVIYSVILIAM